MAGVDQHIAGAHPARAWSVAAAVVLAGILIPFAVWGSSLETWGATALTTAHSQGAIASLVTGLLTADVLLPVPSSLLAVGAGHQLGFVLGVITVWAGLMLGCLVGYGLGSLLGLPGLRRLVGDPGVARARRLLESRRGVLGFGVSRAVPVLSEAVVLFSGATRMRLGLFVRVSALSNAGVALAYASIGALSAAMGSTLPAVAGGVLVPVLAVLLFPRWFEPTDEG